MGSTLVLWCTVVVPSSPVGLYNAAVFQHLMGGGVPLGSRKSYPLLE